MDVLQAMNTGHDGSLSTGHANSCRDMLSRLETMVLMGMELPLPAIRSQIASGIDILVHLGRMRDKSRKVLSITEIAEYKENQIILNEIYRFKECEAEENTIESTEENVEGHIEAYAKEEMEGCVETYAQKKVERCVETYVREKVEGCVEICEKEKAGKSEYIVRGNLEKVGNLIHTEKMIRAGYHLDGL